MKALLIGLVTLVVATLSMVTFSVAEPESKPETFALEGTLKVHPKFLYRYYLADFGDGQKCALLGDELEKVPVGSTIHVEGKLGTRFHTGGTKENPSPFPATCYILMNVEQVKVLREPDVQ